MNNRKRSAGWFFALEKSTMIYSNTEQSTNWRDQLYSYGSNSYTLCMKKRSSGFFTLSFYHTGCLVSGGAQQHGSVDIYLSATSEVTRLRNLLRWPIGQCKSSYWI